MPAAWPAEVMVRSGAPLAAKLSYQMRLNWERGHQGVCAGRYDVRTPLTGLSEPRLRRAYRF